MLVLRNAPHNNAMQISCITPVGAGVTNRHGIAVDRSARKQVAAWYLMMIWRCFIILDDGMTLRNFTSAAEIGVNYRKDVKMVFIQILMGKEFNC
jgi:hypothetical protein